MKNDFPCKSCAKVSKTCCHTQPILTSDELAKLLIKYKDVVNKNKCEPTPAFKGQKIFHNAFYLIPEKIKNKRGEVELDKEYCVFYDKQKSECSIYEDRPLVCRMYGSNKHLPCPFTGMSEEQVEKLPKTAVKKLEKKAKPKIDKLINSDKVYLNTFSIHNIKKLDGPEYMKYTLEDLVVYSAAYYIFAAAENIGNFITVEEEYFLGQNPDKTLSPYTWKILKTDEDIFRPLVSFFNKHMGKRKYIDSIKYDIIANKANAIRRSANLKNCDVENDLKKEELLIYLFVTTLYYGYLDRIEFKKEVNYISRDLLYQIRKDIIIKIDGSYSFVGSEVIQCTEKNAELFLNKIMEELVE